MAGIHGEVINMTNNLSQATEDQCLQQAQTAQGLSNAVCVINVKLYSQLGSFWKKLFKRLIQLDPSFSAKKWCKKGLIGKSYETINQYIQLSEFVNEYPKFRTVPVSYGVLLKKRKGIEDFFEDNPLEETFWKTV